MTEYVINRGIKAYLKNDGKFGNFYFGIALKRPMLREEVTLNALLINVLMAGSREFDTLRKINRMNDELCGGGIDGGCVKKGDFQLLELFGRVNGGSKSIGRLLWVISEILFNPLTEGDAFKQSVVDEEKKRLKETIEGVKNDKRMYAKKRFMSEMFKGEGIGLNAEGYAEDLESITCEGLYRHYMRVISEAEIDIGAAGRFEPYELKNELKIFDIGARDVNRCFYKSAERSKINSIYEKMNVEQGKLCMGLRAEGDFESLRVLNEMLGGGAMSRLFCSIREEQNLCYYISSGVVRGKGVIIVESGISSEKRDEAVREIIKIAKGLAEPEEKEFETAKESIVKRLFTAMDSGMDIINFCLNGALYGGCTSIEEEIEKIKGVSLENVINAAKTLKADTVYFLSREANVDENSGKTVEKRNKVLYN